MRDPLGAAAAETAIVVAAEQLLRRPGTGLPPWISAALEDLTALVAGTARVQATLPDRVTLKKHFAALASGIWEKPLEKMLIRLSGRGRANAGTKLGIPSKELLCATVTEALAYKIRGRSPNPNNAQAHKFCQAFFATVRARAEREGVVFARRDKPVSWPRYLRKARNSRARLIADPEFGNPATISTAEGLALRMIDGSIAAVEKAELLPEPSGRGNAAIERVEAMQLGPRIPAE
jgi:hypothetical protein